MEIKINIPEYNKSTGIKYNWINGFEIMIKLKDSTVILTANKEGLISLANHLLNLAQNEVPNGHHMHFDEFNSLEEGSIDLIIEKKIN